MMRFRTARAFVLLMAPALSFGGCASSAPIDLVAACPPTTLRTGPPPLGPAWIRLRMDARPLIEFGRESYLGETHLAEQQYRVPVAEALLGVFARDLKAAGVFRATTIRAADVQYRVDVDIFHAAASYATGLQSLLPVLPTSALEAYVEVQVQFADADGRVYLLERFADRRYGATSLLGGPRQAAAALFGESLRSIVDRAAARMMDAHREFWAQYPPESRPIARR